MNPYLGVIILMSNYFHDVATALLLASSVVTLIVVKKYKQQPAPETTPYFLSLYHSITGLARFALIWILIGGIPRIIFYHDLEWANMVGKGQVPAIIVKHIIMFLIVGVGAYLWIKIHKDVKGIEELHGKK